VGYPPGSRSLTWDDPFAEEGPFEDHHHKDRETLSVVGQHMVRCCSIGHVEGLACEVTSGEDQGSWREDQGTFDCWQVIVGEVEERRRDP
jgi:hypothetical protein